MDHYDWLPDHQQHVVYSLAHADDLIARAGRILYGYTERGALSLENIAVGDTTQVTGTGVAPIPQAVPRLTSDALNQLRSTLEHVMYAEVMHQVRHPLSAKEARSIEMPAMETPDAFDAWLKHGHRRKLAPLRAGETLCERIRELQPLQRPEPHEHPLRVLVEHTNWSKHRTPSVAATLIGAVIPDGPAEGLSVSTGPDRPVEIGDVLARGPADLQVPLDIWPEISLQRPHTESWHNLLHELRELEQWVREVALPPLIIGTKDVVPLPPYLDTIVGYPDFRAALTLASPTTAAERTKTDLQVGIARDGLAKTLALHPEGSKNTDSIKSWSDELRAEEALHKVGILQQADPQQLDTVARNMIAEALKATGNQ